MQPWQQAGGANSPGPPACPWGLGGSEGVNSSHSLWPGAVFSKHTAAHMCSPLPGSASSAKPFLRAEQKEGPPLIPPDEQHPLPVTFWAGILWEQHRGGMQAPGVGTGADIPGPGLKNVDIVSPPNSSAGVHSPCRRGMLGSGQDWALGDQAVIIWE